MWSLLAAGAAMMVRVDPIELKVMTYNIRYATAPDGDNAWPRRKEALVALVKRHNPDVLGVQEALASQVDELTQALPTHSMIGVGRDDGLRKGEYSALFYRRNKLGLREGGTRWISEEPNTPGSIARGANIPRVFSWGEFYLVGGKRILVLNAHLDHQSPEARLLGGVMMRDFAESRPYPALIMGDFNCADDNPPIQHLLSKGSYKGAKPSQGPFGTFNGFDPKAVDGPMIDHVFTSSDWEVMDTEIDRSSPNGRTPSDHFPLIVRLRLK